MSVGKIIIGGICFVMVIALFGAGCHWFGSGLNVVQNEFSPEAMLKKYEWFKDQSQRIQKSEKDLENLMGESGIRKEYEADNGKDHSKWSPIVQASYNERVGQNSQQRLAQISILNTLIADYNAQSAKFNWGSFRTRDDLPPTTFKVLGE